MKAMEVNGCLGCHALGHGASQGTVGPDLTHVGQFLTRDQIRESILLPNAKISERCDGGPCAPDIMPQTFGKTLSPEDLELIVEALSRRR